MEATVTNTASTLSRITELDGNRSILRHRGHRIEELAERSSYLAISYLTGHLVAVRPGRERPCG